MPARAASSVTREVAAHDVEGVARHVRQRQIGGELIVELRHLDLGLARDRRLAMTRGFGDTLGGRDACELRKVDEWHSDRGGRVALIERGHLETAEIHVPLITGVRGGGKQRRQRAAERLVGARFGAGVVGGGLAVRGVARAGAMHEFVERLQCVRGRGRNQNGEERNEGDRFRHRCHRTAGNCNR